MSRKVLLLSSSKVHGYDYLECAAYEIMTLLNKSKVSRVLFIPYALSDYDGYLFKVKTALSILGYEVDSIHQAGDPLEAIEKAEAFFVGGGNTFQLLNALYEHKLIEPIRTRVLKHGIPYIGSSAGSNVATRSIHTTNDMPIVYPPSFNALNLLPFNINPHYLDPDTSSTHKGETREERILQYLEQSNAGPVLGIREGSCLWVEGDKVFLKGLHSGRLFMPGEEPKEIEVGTELSYLIKDESDEDEM